MGCGSCGITQGAVHAGCRSNGNCGTVGCNKLNTYDWFREIELPDSYSPFDIIEVRFKGSRKEFFKNVNHLELYTGDAIVVESDIGHDVGHVSLTGELVRLQLRKAEMTEENQGIKKIYRLATDSDKEKYTDYKAREPHTLERARTIALELRLEMKLSDIEFQADGRKVIFFYTAEERVDFRELIKRYANEFKTRIEMRQISYREEASRLGGIGSCGRELCCSTWLTDYKIVNISSARYQNLSINMLKLSGQCGRLKCRLNYELDTYMDALTEFPGTDKISLNTKIGTATLQKVDILKKMMWFSYQDKSGDWIPMPVARANEIIAMNKRGEIPDTLVDRPQGAELMPKTSYKVDDMLEDSSLTRLEERSRERRREENRSKDRRSDNRNAQPQGKFRNQEGNNRNRNDSGRPGNREQRNFPPQGNNPQRRDQQQNQQRDQRNRQGNKPFQNRDNRPKGPQQPPRDDTNK